MILVDTNGWSELLKPLRHEGAVAWLAANERDLVLSSIVLAELHYYVAKQPAGARRQRAAATIQAIDAGVGSRFADFAGGTARHYGELMAERRATGRTMPAIDGLIAAQALEGGHSLATRNVADFEGTGLVLIDPWTA